MIEERVDDEYIQKAIEVAEVNIIEAFRSGRKEISNSSNGKISYEIDIPDREVVINGSNVSFRKGLSLGEVPIVGDKPLWDYMKNSIAQRFQVTDDILNQLYFKWFNQVLVGEKGLENSTRQENIIPWEDDETYEHQNDVARERRRRLDRMMNANAVPFLHWTPDGLESLLELRFEIDYKMVPGPDGMEKKQDKYLKLYGFDKKTQYVTIPLFHGGEKIIEVQTPFCKNCENFLENCTCEENGEHFEYAEKEFSSISLETDSHFGYIGIHQRLHALEGDLFDPSFNEGNVYNLSADQEEYLENLEDRKFYLIFIFHNRHSTEDKLITQVVACPIESLIDEYDVSRDENGVPNAGLYMQLHSNPDGSGSATEEGKKKIRTFHLEVETDYEDQDADVDDYRTGTPNKGIYIDYKNDSRLVAKVAGMRSNIIFDDNENVNSRKVRFYLPSVKEAGKDPNFIGICFDVDNVA
jgi:hypothetical protein